MKCPYCGDEESKVIDSRPTEDASASAAAGSVCAAICGSRPTRWWRPSR